MSDYLIKYLGEKLYYLVFIFTTISSTIPLVAKPGQIYNRVFKWYKRVRLLGYLFLISLSLSLYSNYLQNEYNNKKNDVVSSRIEKNVKKSVKIGQSTNESVAYLKNQNAQLKEQVSQLEKDNYALSRELTRAALEINKTVLGSGIAVFELYGSKNHGGYYYGGLKSLSSYPLYDVKSLVVNADSIKGCNNHLLNGRLILDGGCYFKHATETDPVNIPPNVTRFVSYTVKTKADYISLEIKTTARNIKFVQQGVFKLMLGTCIRSYKVYVLNNEEKATLVKSVNDLNISDADWNKIFLRVQNRGINLDNT